MLDRVVLVGQALCYRSRSRGHMTALKLSAVVVAALALSQPSPRSVEDEAERHLINLIRIDTTNPPGHETGVAAYLKREADAHGIPAELLGPDPDRLSFVARLKGAGPRKPLLLVAHSDVVPAEASQWSVDPFAATIKGGAIYGRGAEDIKSLLAAELSVLIELQRRWIPLNRDVILLVEADEEAGSTAMSWLVQNAFPKIDAEFALNEMGYWVDRAPAAPAFYVQTSEKVPTRIRLTARGTAGHGSLPRDDNPVAHLVRAVSRLAEAEQPVAFNETTRVFFQTVQHFPEYHWLPTVLSSLQSPDSVAVAAREMRRQDPELSAMLQTTVTPTMLQAGVKVNVIPNVAVGYLDVRRLPTETKDEVYERFRRIIDDPSVTIESAGGQEMPATPPSSVSSDLYVAMQTVFSKVKPGAVTVPLLMRGASDGAFLRAKGIPVYGVPLFRKEGDFRWHGNDERISIANLHEGTALLMQIVLAVAGGDGPAR